MAALRFFFYLLMKPAAIGMAFLGLTGVAAPYTDPNTWWIPAFSGLFMPGILLANFFLLIYWAIHKKVWMLLPLLAILLNYNYFTSMFQWPWKNLPAAPANNTFTIASYNVEGFYWISRNKDKAGLSNFIRNKHIDLLCIQEHCEESHLDSATIHRRIGLPHRVVFFNRKTDWANFGLSIYSRYPILRYDTIGFGSKKNASMWADVLVEGDTIRIFNNHLQTTDVNINRKIYDQYKSIKNWKGQARTLVHILEQLKDNFRERARQAHLVRSIITRSPYPVIVCGDFNDTPISYAFNYISGNTLSDGFRTCGKGYSRSFNGIKGLLRIDFIAYASAFTGLNYYSPYLPWSDHNPVIMSFALN